MKHDLEVEHKARLKAEERLLNLTLSNSVDKEKLVSLEMDVELLKLGKERLENENREFRKTAEAAGNVQTRTEEMTVELSLSQSTGNLPARNGSAPVTIPPHSPAGAGIQDRQMVKGANVPPGAVASSGLNPFQHRLTSGTYVSTHRRTVPTHSRTFDRPAG